MPISTPPIHYNLDRPGTSGISSGPRLTVLDSSGTPTLRGTVGRICVRGEAVFPGYLKADGSIDKSVFDSNGWFDTGDLGYLDTDGYLYITGRSKEVINRGGELISPFEVENAILASAALPDSPLYGKVTQALAFSVSHDVLQEAVGAVLVCPPDVPRPDLRLLHQGLRSVLQQIKWPVLITYIDDLPKNNNKVLRINLGKRLGLPELTDATPYSEQHWEAACPPPDTPLSSSISSSPCHLDAALLSQTLQTLVIGTVTVHVRQLPGGGHLDAILAPNGQRTLPPLGTDTDIEESVQSSLLATVHAYLVPKRIRCLNTVFPLLDDGSADWAVAEELLDSQIGPESNDASAQTTESRLAQIFADLLACEPADIDRDADFFSIGGDSLLAGKLLSSIRTAFQVPVPVELVFNQGSVRSLSQYVEEHSLSEDGDSETSEAPSQMPCQETHSSTNPWLLMLQLAPLAVFYPLRRAFQWTVFMLALSHTQSWPTSTSVAGRLFNLTICVLLSRTITRVIAPCLGIAAKWLIIGRYREGIYPMWGAYHTRWWLVQKATDVCGLGMFGSSNATRILYCRLMGARIGRGVHMGDAKVGEWDLLDIGDGATLDAHAVCRPFAVERNTAMYLGRIAVGRDACVGRASIVAPGTVVPDGVCIGPNSSSWELGDADEANRDLCASRIPGSHWALAAFVTAPLVVLQWVVSLLPWLAGLVGLVMGEVLDSRNPLYSIVAWFATPHRVGFHYLALLLRVSAGPFLTFAYAVAVRWVLDRIFGPLGPGPAKRRGQVDVWRASLMKTLMPVSQLHEMTSMLGHHYEGTSVAIRLLGGKVGKRVYWPGTGPSIGDYHLLDIGNDVVFGSRSHLVTSDGMGSDVIRIEDGAMIADRVCVLPGVTIGKGAIMGSGAVTRRDKEYAAYGTYVGSKGGDAVCLGVGHDPSSDHKLRASSDAGSRSSGETVFYEKGAQADDPESVSPFGRAFYRKQAPYRVFGPLTIFLYSSFMTIFTTFFWNVPSVTSIQIVDAIARSDGNSIGDGHWYDTPTLFLLTFTFIAALTTLLAALALGLVVGAKWLLLGRRQPGNYDWDQSSYCQRWQLFLTAERLRRDGFGGHGVAGMLTGTHWLVLYFRALGAAIGRDCALFANGRPSLLLTEPDLLRLGDRVAIDDASLVSHINTRGKFDLNRLEVGDRCVLRTGSRLLSGATMQEDSCLLEHTLIMGGDLVAKGATMQGWPAAGFKGDSVILGASGGNGAGHTEK